MLQNWQLGSKTEARRYASYSNNWETHGYKCAVSVGDMCASSYHFSGKLQKLTFYFGDSIYKGNSWNGLKSQSNHSDLEMTLFKSQTSYELSGLYFHRAFLMAGELFLGLHQLDSMCGYKLVQKERNLKVFHEAILMSWWLKRSIKSKTMTAEIILHQKYH